MKRFHMWLHNHYEEIRFYIAMGTAAVVIVVLIGNTHKLQESIDLNRQVTNQRADQVKKVIDELKADNSQQTQLIACLLAIHGQTIKISSDDATKCEENATKQINNKTFSLGQSLAPTSPAAPTANSAQNNPSTPTSPSEPPRPSVSDRLSQVINNVLKWIDESP